MIARALATAQKVLTIDQKPKPVDFPTIVTALIFDRVTKLIDAYEGKNLTDYLYLKMIRIL